MAMSTRARIVMNGGRVAIFTNLVVVDIEPESRRQMRACRKGRCEGGFFLYGKNPTPLLPDLSSAINHAPKWFGDRFNGFNLLAHSNGKLKADGPPLTLYQAVKTPV